MRIKKPDERKHRTMIRKFLLLKALFGSIKNRPPLVATRHPAYSGAVMVKVGSIHPPFTLTVFPAESMRGTLT